MSTVYRARLIVPISADPLPNGCVEVDGGKIVSVHARPPSNAIDLGDVAILPGLINAHTHLEFSDLAAPLQPASPFTSWLNAVIGNRRSNPAGSEVSLRKGWQECRDAGVAAVGEIASRGWTPAAFGGDGPFVLAFHESLGLREDRIEAELAAAREHLSAARELGPEIMAGLSPHAPYSVHPELVRGLAALAREHQVPLAMHLAETREELRLLADGTGEFVDFLARLGVWSPSAIPTGTRILDYLRQLEPAPRVLVVHGNFLTEEDIGFLATRPRFSVAYCPRTHAFFGHPPHPWRRLISSGVRVVLGTDSRASNPDLSIWEEARFLHARHPEVPAERLLKMITLDAAAALGLDDRLGSLEPGKRAAFVTVPHREDRLTPAIFAQAPRIGSCRLDAIMDC